MRNTVIAEGSAQKKISKSRWVYLEEWNSHALQDVCDKWTHQKVWPLTEFLCVLLNLKSQPSLLSRESIFKF